MSAPPHMGSLSPSGQHVSGGLMPLLRGSFAAAVVIAVLFAIGWVACIANYLYTKYQRYLIQSISCILRALGFACRAAALKNFSTAVYATSFAGAAAGFGISIAVLILVLADWVKHARVFKDSPRRKLAYALVILLFPCIIILGPISGILSAGLVFSGSQGTVLTAGLHFREVAVYGMTTILGVTIIISTVYLVMAAGRLRNLSHEDEDDLLLIILVALGLILMVRAASGAASLSHPIINNHDSYFYGLEALPELVELTIFCIPTLMARVGKASIKWPSLHKLAKEAAKAEALMGGTAFPYASAQAGISEAIPKSPFAEVANGV